MGRNNDRRFVLPFEIYFRDTLSIKSEYTTRMCNFVTAQFGKMAPLRAITLHEESCRTPGLSDVSLQFKKKQPKIKSNKWSTLRLTLSLYILSQHKSIYNWVIIYWQLIFPHVALETNCHANRLLHLRFILITPEDMFIFSLTSVINEKTLHRNA